MEGCGRVTATAIRIDADSKLAYKELIDDQLWQRLVGRIVKDEGLEPQVAERIMNEALGFLQLCAMEPSVKHGPSDMVDIGWHTFILYTREYASFCQRIAGRFIHHEPTDIPGMDAPGVSCAQTVQAMLSYGPVDEVLWSSAVPCNDSGCRGSSCNQSCAGG